MKYATGYSSNNIYNKYLLHLGIVLIGAAIIWFGGAHFAVKGTLPLAPPEKRFILIALLFLLCTFKLFFLDTNQPVTEIPPNPVIAKDLQVLENRLRGAVQFLKENALTNKNGKTVILHHLPWYLLVGSSGAGKTTLLANSGVHFVLDKKFKRDTIRSIPPSDTCDWWVTRNVVLVDVPGRYITAGGRKASLVNKFWEGFLGLVKSLREEKGLAGVVIAISVPELMSLQQREELVSDLRRSMAELKCQFGEDLSFYLVITKCDVLPGFLDFFSDCSAEELAQIWGVTMPQLSERDVLSGIFVERFNALIRRLNQQLILRLHQERNPFARIHIKDFPFQIERLKDACADVLDALTSGDEPLVLKGVYLTCAMQDVTTEQVAGYPQTALPHEFQYPLQIMQSPPLPMHAYFIKQFILHGLHPADHPSAPEGWPSQLTNWIFKST